MSDQLLALILTFVLLAALFLWVPLLHTAEALSHRYPLQNGDDMPNLVEEDTGPHFTGEVA